MPLWRRVWAWTLHNTTAASEFFWLKQLVDAKVDSSWNPCFVTWHTRRTVAQYYQSVVGILVYKWTVFYQITLERYVGSVWWGDDNDKKNHVIGGTCGLSGWKQTNGALQKSSQTHCLSDAYWDTTGFPLTSSPTVTAPLPFSWNCFLPSSLCGTNHCWLPKFKSALCFCLSICYCIIQLCNTHSTTWPTPPGCWLFCKKPSHNLEGIVMSHDQIAELAVRNSDWGNSELSPITFG